MAKRCVVCSKLDIDRLTHPLYPCRNPLPCSTPPTERAHGTYLALGSVDEIRRRRSTCDICKLVAEGLDKEPPDLGGECRIRESAEFCNFELPSDVQARDHRITHFHFTQLSVIFDTSSANQFQGPSLPWELKARDALSSHFVLNFQVKARSSVASPRTEHGFLDTIGGRYVTAQANAKLIRAWLDRCESKHGKACMPYRRLPVGRDKGPAFVVDVIHACIVDTPSQCRYVALSYVWGTASVFKHLSENTKDLRRTRSLQTLPIPATIRDAITLVRAIGERYLWVDSLCIIQNDWRMQQTEIMRMGSIYSQALFTIIAAAGDNANSGLPGVERGSREQVQKILRLADCELLTVIDIKLPSAIDHTVWAQRAWTFQERVLSNRVLVFSENQVYWSCRVASHSEERALEEIMDIRRLHSPFPHNQLTDCLSWERLSPSQYRAVYGDLLSGYRQRHLSYQTDMLNAFKGVSEILSVIQDDMFFWGLPESFFSYAMTWSFTGHATRNYVEVTVSESNGSQEKVPIPSWSWAAWSGPDPDYLPFLHAGYSAHVRPMIQFDIVDANHQLVRIKERSWEGHSESHLFTRWKHEQPHCQPAKDVHVSRIGHLHFWTSLANLATLRSRGGQCPGRVDYIPFFPPSALERYLSHPHTEMIRQDFIVVAACELQTLTLLAIEWKDGVAYRVGQVNVKEEDWTRVENKQWRLIVLG